VTCFDRLPLASITATRRPPGTGHVGPSPGRGRAKKPEATRGVFAGRRSNGVGRAGGPASLAGVQRSASWRAPMSRPHQRTGQRQSGLHRQPDSWARTLRIGRLEGPPDDVGYPPVPSSRRDLRQELAGSRSAAPGTPRRRDLRLAPPCRSAEQEPHPTGQTRRAGARIPASSGRNTCRRTVPVPEVPGQLQTCASSRVAERPTLPSRPTERVQVAAEASFATFRVYSAKCRRRATQVYARAGSGTSAGSRDTLADRRRHVR